MAASRPRALLCLVAVLLAGGRAAAHAQLIAATPPAEAVVAEAPPEVVLEFNEPVAALVARWFPSGGDAPLEAAARSEGARLLVPVPDGLGTGTHVLSWRVVSTDGTRSEAATSSRSGRRPPWRPRRPEARHGARHSAAGC